MIFEYYGDGLWIISEPYHRRDERRVWAEPWPYGWSPPAPARYTPPGHVDALPEAHPLLRITVLERSR